MKKKALALFLSLTMLATAFTGCGNKEATKTNNKKDSVTTTDTANEGDAKTDEGGPDISKPVTLKWYLHGSNVSDASGVLEKANEYLKEKLNVTLEPIWGTWGDFDTNVVLSINGGDDVDIYFTSSWTPDEYNQFAKKGAWVRLDDPENNLIEQYAPDLWPILPDVLKAGAVVDGRDGLGTYGVPAYKDIATQNCWDVNVTLLEKYGYTIDDIKNTDYYGFGEILETVKKGEGADFYPLLVEGVVLERMVNNSIIVTCDAGTNNLLSHYIDPTDVSKEGIYGNKILSKFETPEYKKFIEKSREYYLAGYIDPAMANQNQANDARTTAQLNAKYLIGTQSFSLGYDVQVSRERKIDVQMVPVTPAYIDTTSTQGGIMAISTASKNPERAMMFLNLLNTDPYLMTLMNYGIEGVHYDMVDGEAVFTEERSNYIPWTNGMGNVTILPPQEGQGADFYDRFKAYYAEAKEIPIFGWALNPESVQTEMGALANVAAEYALALNTGAVDPAKKLPEFIEKLKANGIDKVVETANTQLDEYMSTRK